MPDTRRPIIWKHPGTWMPTVTEWLRPRLGRNALARLSREDVSRLHPDDSEWLEMLDAVLRPAKFEIEEKFAKELEGKTIRAYHGCRTADAGEYFRRGIRVHRREELEAGVRALVESDKRLWPLRATIENRMAEIESGIDDHRCFVVLDDRFLLERAPHYLIYGSEWISAVLGHGWREPLLERGAPTIIEIDLPLNWVSDIYRKELANLLLSEWVRQIVSRPKRVFFESFTFTLERDVPPGAVVGHRHPKRLKDNLEHMRAFVAARTTCLHCEERTNRLRRPRVGKVAPNTVEP